MSKKLFELRLADGYDPTWLCTDVRMAYKYVDGKRTDTVEGFFYRCLHPQALGEGVYDIKVCEPRAAVRPEDIPPTGTQITFENLRFVEWTDRRTGALRISGRADHAEA